MAGERESYSLDEGFVRKDGTTFWCLVSASCVRLETEAAPDVLVASSQIEQVVINLVSNAAKAIPAGRTGTIVLRVGPAAGSVRLEVTDDGVGIPPSTSSASSSRSSRPARPATQRGIGIGLAIRHSIVEVHGGALTVESRPGKGSTFCMTLPPAPADA